ncbi:MAG: chromate transporter [Firmicutes bacterium]|nr:chromate transporter [Bacillota bacterium]
MILFQLFFSFLKIGFTSFGGMSMIPLINSEMAAHGWMTVTEVSDIVAIAEMTPGPLGLNCATFAGMRVAGIFGALAANLGILGPTFSLCAAAAFAFEKFKDSTLLKGVLTGVRPVGIGLVAGVILNLICTNYGTLSHIMWGNVAIAALCMLLLLKYKMSIPKVIGIAAALGLLQFAAFGIA